MIKHICFITTFSLLTLSISADIDNKSKQDISPVLKIEQPNKRGQQNRSPIDALKNQYRTITGERNNEATLNMGAALTPLARIIVKPDYGDSISTMAGSNRRSARAISNIVSAQSELITNTLGASDFLWQWGQFLDHDIALTDGTDPAENENIIIPDNDEYFIPGTTMSFNRSLYQEASSPRQQLNEVSAWIDASNVYGSEEERANALRTFDGSGKLTTSTGDLLPFNKNGFPNAGGDSTALFLAGDVRANEQIGLTAMHTLFVREHNRLATELAITNPELSGDEIYEQARKIVGAQMQVITYKEFLPALLGKRALKRYKGYKKDTDSAIANSFSSAAYRFGHSALNPTLLRLDSEGNESSRGHLALKDAFFSPTLITDGIGIDSLLRGLATQEAQKIDVYVIDDVRNFLFGTPSSNGFDLASLNIQRGRDHGLPSYNDSRKQLGLKAVTEFSDISSDTIIQERLAQAYTSVDNIDLWVGGLSEDSLGDSHLGELFSTIVSKQFAALRDGDRFWYQRTFKGKALKELEKTTLADIIRRNTNIGDELQDNVFKVIKKE